jgi:hypothetical protein
MCIVLVLIRSLKPLVSPLTLFFFKARQSIATTSKEAPEASQGANNFHTLNLFAGENRLCASATSTAFI